MKMSLLIAIGVGICLPISSIRAQDTAAVQKQIEANEAAVNQAIHAMDFEALSKLWSPQMHVNSPGNNILTREMVFGAMRQNKLKYASDKVTMEDFYVAGDVAVEMGHEDVVMANGPMAGKPLTRRYTDVWQRTGDQWVQVARQATILYVDGGGVYGHPAPAAGQ